MISIGSLFGSLVLMLSDLFAEDSSGSNLISIDNQILTRIEAVEDKVTRVGDDVVFLVSPAGNRFRLDERRIVKISVGEAVLPSGVEYEWGVQDPIQFQATSDNDCEGILLTELDRNSYAFRNLSEKGEMHDQIYVQINAPADFTMSYTT